MAPKRKINLLPGGKFELSTTGKLLGWAVTVGRWIVVFTELIVICAFLSRFYFDTKLANLFDDIKQKKAIVASAANFEEEFRQTQQKIKIVKTLTMNEKKPSAIVNDLGQLLPIDITLTNFSVEEKNVSIVGYSLSESSLKTFWKNLNLYPKMTQTTLVDVSSRKDGAPGISFKISGIIK